MAHRFESSDLRQRYIEACMSPILVALETKQFNKVREWTLLQHEFYNRERDYRFKLDCASSLADLGEKNYYSATQGFLNLVKDVVKYDYSEVLSSENIITYGLVSAMATIDRAKLQGALRKVMEPVGVVHHLKEIIKPFGVVFYLTEIIKHFLEERFSTCIELFENQRPRLLLDFYLFEHVDSLFMEINGVMVAGYLKSLHDGICGSQKRE